jgi:predicted NBD/HSP70 family sugar kinase
MMGYMPPDQQPAARRNSVAVSSPTELLSPHAVGGINRARVLRALADHGPLSRSDLARLAGVTRATIGTIVRGLIDDEILEEGEALNRGLPGKRARPLWFARGAGMVVAVELKSEGARGAVIDAQGTVYATKFTPFRDRASTEDVAGVVAKLAKSLTGRHPVLGVGIAVPGTTSLAEGEVIGSLQVGGAKGGRLVREIRRATGLPAFVENDARAQALAEQWFGLGRGLSTFISVQTGAGLSVGLVLDGAVYRGPHGFAGELGHTAVELDGEQCTCGLRGCWETAASIHWLRRTAADAGIRDATSIDSERLSELATRGDVAAQRLMKTYADRLAIGLANLRQLLGSDYFIIHGDAVGGGDTLLAMLNEATNARTLGPVEVVFTELGEEATILGGVATVLGALLHTSG